MALRIMLHGHHPQAAIDALCERDHQIVVKDPLQDYNFGGAQVIYRMPEGHSVAATESRKVVS